jgi:hypothetical protein
VEIKPVLQDDIFIGVDFKNGFDQSFAINEYEFLSGAFSVLYK